MCPCGLLENMVFFFQASVDKIKVQEVNISILASVLSLYHQVIFSIIVAHVADALSGVSTGGSSVKPFRLSLAITLISIGPFTALLCLYR